MSTRTRIMRSKGESDGLSLPTRTRPTRKDTTSGRNGGTALNITGNAGRDQQQQMPTQTPHLTQSPQATSAERTEATTPMLPPGPHRLLKPHMPLPTSPTSSSRSRSSAPLFKEDKYSSTLEEESEADAEVTFIHGRSNGTFVNNQANRPTSTPTTSDYTTQGDPDASPSPSNLFRSNVTSDKFLGTNNVFVPDGSNRRIHQIDNKVFHAGYLENGNNAYLLELPALEKMLNTWKFLMDEMSGQFYAVYETATSGCPRSQCYNKHGLPENSSTNWPQQVKLLDTLGLPDQHHHWPWECSPLPVHHASQMICCPDNQHRRLYSTNLHPLNSPGRQHAS